MLPVDGGLEATGRRWRFVRPAGRIAERARLTGAPATIVPHRLVRMLFAYPTLAAAPFAVRLSHCPIRSG
jgi:hypothetical protein